MTDAGDVHADSWQLRGALSGVLLAVSLRIGFGRFHPLALLLVTLALGIALSGVLEQRSHGRLTQLLGRVSLERLLALALVLFVALPIVVRPSRNLGPSELWALRALAVVSLPVAMSYLRPAGVLARQRFWLLLALFAVGALVCLWAGPPHIDVWTFQQRAAEALIHGANPYAIDYPNIYGDTRFYAPEVLVADRIVTFPYPPLTVFWDLPWHALGDVRYGMLVAMLAAAALLRRVGGVSAELAALVALVQPVSLHVILQAWTEPTVWAAWALLLWALQRTRTAPSVSGLWTAGLALGLCAATKQYTPILLVPIVVALPSRRWKLLTALAFVVVAVTLAPFALWDASELWRDVVLMQLWQPLRADALSYLALVQRVAGVALPAGLGFGAAGLVLALGLWSRPNLGRAALVSATAFLAFLLLNKQAFCNYYWLAAALLLSTAALKDRSTSRSWRADGSLPGHGGPESSASKSAVAPMPRTAS